MINKCVFIIVVLIICFYFSNQWEGLACGELLIDNFVYSAKDLKYSDDLPKCSTNYKIIQTLKNEKKEKAITILEQITSYDDIFQSTTKLYATSFDLEYVRIFTLGGGLCSLHALGDKNFSVLKNVKVKCALTHIHDFIERNNCHLFLKNVVSSTDIKTFNDVLKLHKTNFHVFESARQSYLKDDGKQSVYDAVFHELQSIFVGFERVGVKDKQETGSVTHFLCCMYDILNNNNFLSGLDWPTYSVVYDWYNTFAREMNRNVCLFNNNPFGDTDLSNFGEWTCFCANGVKKNANTDDLLAATDYIVFDNGHFSRVIPRNKLSNLKKIVSGQSDILMLEAKEYYDHTKNVVTRITN